MDPHTVSFDTGIGMHTHCAKWQYGDLLCGADWASDVIKAEFLHLCEVILRGGMTYLFFHPCFASACVGELQWSRYDSSKVSLSPHHGCLLELSLSHQAKGLVYDFGCNHNQDHLRIGCGWYDQQQHILIVVLDPWGSGGWPPQTQGRGWQSPLFPLIPITDQGGGSPVPALHRTGSSHWRPVH